MDLNLTLPALYNMIKDTTIIMPVRNRLKLTKQTIETLNQTVDFKCKIIIMADNVDNEMKNYLDSTKLETYYMNFGHFNDKKVPQSIGQDILRAIAVSIVNTQFIYFTDNDIYFTKNWLDKLYEVYFSMSSPSIVGGRTHPFHNVYETMSNCQLTNQQAGYSMLIEKKTWDKIALNRKRFDDVGLCNEAKRKGILLAQPIEPVIFHCGMTNSWGEKVYGYDLEIKQKFPKDCIYE